MNFPKLTTAVVAMLCASVSFAQNNSNPWPTTGSVGIGTTTSNFSQLQLHGTTDYVVSEPAVFGGGSPLTINYGKTSMFGLTNTTTGNTINDGTMIRMSGTAFDIKNNENGSIKLSSGTAIFSMSGSSNKIQFGSNPIVSQSAYLNVVSTSDNGLYIYTSSTAKYGLSIRSRSDSDNAIQVMGTTGTARNFAVRADGQVYARKYTTTLNNIPDYVFQPGYNLMPLADLKQYISEHSHLPNIPSANEYMETGVDLGEMNRLLLEKVEELTLYIIDLEERMKKMEEKP